MIRLGGKPGRDHDFAATRGQWDLQSPRCEPVEPWSACGFSRASILPARTGLGCGRHARYGLDTAAEKIPALRPNATEELMNRSVRTSLCTSIRFVVAVTALGVSTGGAFAQTAKTDFPSRPVRY